MGIQVSVPCLAPSPIQNQCADSTALPTRPIKYQLHDKIFDEDGTAVWLEFLMELGVTEGVGLSFHIAWLTVAFQIPSFAKSLWTMELGHAGGAYLLEQ